MRLILGGFGVMFAGLALLMAMVIGLIEPGLGLSLLGYASFFAGMMLGLSGAIARARKN